MIVLQVSAKEQGVVAIRRDFVIQFEDVGVVLDGVVAGKGVCTPSSARLRRRRLSSASGKSWSAPHS